MNRSWSLGLTAVLATVGCNRSKTALASGVRAPESNGVTTREAAMQTAHSAINTAAPTPMPSSNFPVFAPLSDQDRARLDAQRAVVSKVAHERYGLALKQNRQDLNLLQRLVDEKVFKPSQTYELQALGVVFGDALANEVPVRWVMVTDEYGTDPTLRYQQTTIQVNALTTISKRIEEGRSVQLVELFDALVRDLPRIANDSQKP